MVLVLRVLCALGGIVLALTQTPWTAPFIVGLILVAVCAISFLPDVLDEIDF